MAERDADARSGCSPRSGTAKGLSSVSAPSPRTPTSSPEVVPLLDAVAGHRTDDGNGDLTGTVITADALHVHRGNIEALLDRGGEYVLRRAGQPADAGTRARRALPRRVRRRPRTTSPSTAATAAPRSARSL